MKRLLLPLFPVLAICLLIGGSISLHAMGFKLDFDFSVATTLYPAYSDETIVDTIDLSGTWTAQRENEDALEIVISAEPGSGNRLQSDEKDERAEKEAYDEFRMVFREDGGEIGTFEAHLFSLNDHLLLDLLPLRPEEVREELEFFVPTHVFARITIDGDRLDFTWLNFFGIADFIKEKPEAIEHKVHNGNVLITASTPELQSFFSRMLDDEDFAREYEFFLDMVTFARK